MIESTAGLSFGKICHLRFLLTVSLEHSYTQHRFITILLMRGCVVCVGKVDSCFLTDRFHAILYYKLLFMDIRDSFRDLYFCLYTDGSRDGNFCGLSYGLSIKHSNFHDIA